MAPFIPKARPTEINDRTLSTLTRIARDVQHGNCTEAEAEWLLTSAAALLEELARYRAADLTREQVNVITLPVGRG